MTSDAYREKIANLTAQTRGHIKRTLHVDVKQKPRAVAQRVLSDAGLRDDYAVVVMEVAGTHCLFLLSIEAPTPARIAKDAALLARRLKMPVVLATSEMTSSARAQLISQGVPFVVPGKQIYLPFLGLDLRETFRSPVNVRRGALSPVAQVTLFVGACSPVDEITPSDLVGTTGYSAMSLGRAFDELATHGPVRVEKRGREKVLSFRDSPRETILSCKELLSRPARGIHGVKFRKRQPEMIQAGEVALSALTGVKLDALPTFAIVSAGWKPWFDENGIEDVNDIDEADALIEIWRYDPAILSDGPHVDPLSLYAQFWADPNPRLASAAEALLRELPG